MVDMVVHRHNLRDTIGSLAAILTRRPAPADLGKTQPSARVPMRELMIAAEGDDDLVTAPPEAAHAE